jgi:hypothetical protein
MNGPAIVQARYSLRAHPECTQKVLVGDVFTGGGEIRIAGRRAGLQVPQEFWNSTRISPQPTLHDGRAERIAGLPTWKTLICLHRRPRHASGRHWLSHKSTLSTLLWKEGVRDQFRDKTIGFVPLWHRHPEVSARLEVRCLTEWATHRHNGYAKLLSTT